MMNYFKKEESFFEQEGIRERRQKRFTGINIFIFFSEVFKDKSIFEDIIVCFFIQFLWCVINLFVFLILQIFVFKFRNRFRNIILNNIYKDIRVIMCYFVLL